jgi:hypothetical protein
MITRATITLLALAAAPSLAAQQPPKKPAVPPRVEQQLFVGQGTLPSLPKTPIIPTAADIETQAKRLGSRMRNMDPFGLSTFPREEDTLAPAPLITRAAEKVTLNQALQTLNVTGINLDKKEILFRGRNVFEGDVMVLSFKNELFLAQVLEVNASQILFRDVKRNEGGVLPHSLLPHLELEPIHKRTGGLEEMLIPMETSKPITQ